MKEEKKDYPEPYLTKQIEARKIVKEKRKEKWKLI